MSSIGEFTKYPICDTDIWVNVCLGNIEDRLFEKHGKIIVADVVDGEINKWNKSEKFSKIATQYMVYKDNNKVLVVDHKEHLSEEDRLIINNMLYQFKFTNGLENKPAEKNKGEYVSAIYANHFKIPLLKTDDRLFKEDGQGKKDFPRLQVKNWRDTLIDLIPNDTERIKVTKLVESENQRMNRENTKYKENQAALEEQKIQEKLAALQSKWARK